MCNHSPSSSHHSGSNISTCSVTILTEGTDRHDRTGTGTWSIFGYQMRFNLSDGFSAPHHQEAPPAVDYPRTAVVSRGDTNIKYLNDNGVEDMG